MTEAREIELKLELSCTDADRFGEAPAFGSRPPELIAQHAIYFDTSKSILRRAGFSFRVRRSGDHWVQTLKHQGRGASTLLDRPEWEWKVEGGAPDFAALEPTPLARLMSPRKMGKSLAPRFEVRVERRKWTVRRAGSEIEVVLDEGEAMAGGRSEPLCEVELELKKGRESDLFDLARELGDVVPLRLGVRTKAERGYGLVGSPASRLGRSKKAEPLTLSAGMSVAEAFAAIVHTCLRHFRLNEDWIERERDPGALHQSRVAMRRLRSALTLFRPAVGGEEYERIREELRWFTGQLGEARNLDVFCARLPRRRGGKEPKAEKAVRAALSERRESAYDRAIEALGSARVRRLMLDLVAWVETGEWRSGGKAGRPIELFAAKQVARRWKRVRQAGSKLRTLNEEPLHRLRIDIKKLRYASEFFKGLASSEEEG
ncbi:MAG: CYTH and CHAD domain-containing protein, partial [Allosphingosinicella sp.]